MTNREKVNNNEQEILQMRAERVPINQIANKIGVQARYIHELLLCHGEHWLNETEGIKIKHCKLCKAKFKAPAYTEHSKVLCIHCRKVQRALFWKVRHNLQLRQTYILDLLSKGYGSSLIADMTGLSRTGVHKIMNKHNIKTAPRSYEAACFTCGKIHKRVSSKEKVIKTFCCEGCYHAWIQANSYYEGSSYGSRVAREVVKQHFELKEGMIVHHINGIGTDNRLSNLMVYACQGDHLRAHRGQDIKPLWIYKN